MKCFIKSKHIRIISGTSEEEFPLCDWGKCKEHNLQWDPDRPGAAGTMYFIIPERSKHVN